MQRHVSDNRGTESLGGTRFGGTRFGDTQFGGTQPDEGTARSGGTLPGRTASPAGVNR